MIDTIQIDGIHLLKFTQGKVNAMNLEFCRALSQGLVELAEDDSCRACVLATDSRVFSAGVDLKRCIAEDDEYLKQFLPALTNVFRVLFEFPKPLVAAISGHAVAGGCLMSSACDYRLISPRAKVGIPELRVGVPLPSIAIEIIRHIAAPQAFQVMVNIGSTYSGELALANGLADELCEKEVIRDSAVAKARQLSNIPAEVFSVTKKQMRQPGLDRAKKNESLFEEQVQAIWYSPDQRQVIANYVGDRLG